MYHVMAEMSTVRICCAVYIFVYLWSNLNQAASRRLQCDANGRVSGVVFEYNACCDVPV